MVDKSGSIEVNAQNPRALRLPLSTTNKYVIKPGLQQVSQTLQSDQSLRDTSRDAQKMNNPSGVKTRQLLPRDVGASKNLVLSSDNESRTQEKRCLDVGIASPGASSSKGVDKHLMCCDQQTASACCQKVEDSRPMKDLLKDFTDSKLVPQPQGRSRAGVNHPYWAGCESSLTEPIKSQSQTGGELSTHVSLQRRLNRKKFQPVLLSSVQKKPITPTMQTPVSKGLRPVAKEELRESGLRTSMGKMRTFEGGVDAGSGFKTFKQLQARQAPTLTEGTPNTSVCDSKVLAQVVVNQESQKHRQPLKGSSRYAPVRTPDNCFNKRRTISRSVLATNKKQLPDQQQQSTQEERRLLTNTSHLSSSPSKEVLPRLYEVSKTQASLNRKSTDNRVLRQKVQDAASAGTQVRSSLRMYSRNQADEVKAQRGVGSDARQRIKQSQHYLLSALKPAQVSITDSYVGVRQEQQQQKPSLKADDLVTPDESAVNGSSYGPYRNKRAQTQLAQPSRPVTQSEHNGTDTHKNSNAASQVVTPVDKTPFFQQEQQVTQSILVTIEKNRIVTGSAEMGLGDSDNDAFKTFETVEYASAGQAEDVREEQDIALPNGLQSMCKTATVDGAKQEISLCEGGNVQEPKEESQKPEADNSFKSPGQKYAIKKSVSQTLTSNLKPSSDHQSSAKSLRNSFMRQTVSSQLRKSIKEKKPSAHKVISGSQSRDHTPKSRQNSAIKPQLQRSVAGSHGSSSALLVKVPIKNGSRNNKLQSSQTASCKSIKNALVSKQLIGRPTQGHLPPQTNNQRPKHKVGAPYRRQQATEETLKRSKTQVQSRSTLPQQEVSKTETVQDHQLEQKEEMNAQCHHHNRAQLHNLIMQGATPNLSQIESSHAPGYNEGTAQPKWQSSGRQATQLHQLEVSELKTRQQLTSVSTVQRNSKHHRLSYNGQKAASNNHHNYNESTTKAVSNLLAVRGQATQPQFVQPVTQKNAGSIVHSVGSEAHQATATARESERAMGKIQLQEILDEVASIEQRYHLNGGVESSAGTVRRMQENGEDSILADKKSIESRNEAIAVSPHVESPKSMQQIASRQPHVRKVESKLNAPAAFDPETPYEVSRFLQDPKSGGRFASTSQNRIFKHTKKASSTQSNFHKPQNSMKLSSNSGSVISPRKSSKPRNGSRRDCQSIANAQTYITYTKGQVSNQGTYTGRKSLNFPVRSTNASTHRKSSHMLAASDTTYPVENKPKASAKVHNMSPSRDPSGQSTIRSRARVLGFDGQVVQPATSPQTLTPMALSSIPDGVQRAEGEINDPQRQTIEIVENPHQQSQLQIYPSNVAGHKSQHLGLSNLSSDANQRMLTDKEQFGSFRIDTDSQAIVLRSDERSVVPVRTQGRNSRTSNPKSRDNSIKGQKKNGHEQAQLQGLAQPHGTAAILPTSSSVAPLANSVRQSVTEPDQARLIAGTNPLPVGETPAPVMCLSPDFSNTGLAKKAPDSRIDQPYIAMHTNSLDDMRGPLVDYAKGEHQQRQVILDRLVSQPPIMASAGGQQKVNQADPQAPPSSSALLRELTQSARREASRPISKSRAMELQATLSAAVKNEQGKQPQITKKMDILPNNGAFQNENVDKRKVPMTGSSKVSRSPLPHKKQVSANQHTMNATNSNYYKQNLKQLGLSYGILAKQDAQNRLVGSRKRGGPSTGHQKDHFSPKKTKSGKGSKATGLDSSLKHAMGVFTTQELQKQFMLLEGNQMVTYDDQTALSPQNASEVDLRHPTSGAGIIAKSQLTTGRFGLSGSKPSRYSQEPSGHITTQLQVTSSPQRFGSSTAKQGLSSAASPGVNADRLQKAAQNQLIMKRMPELSVAPTAIGTNGVTSHLLPQTQRGRLFKYQVLNGNNAALVKRVMQETRSYLWTEMSNNQQSHFHFRWSPVSRQVNFERLSHNFGQIVNHFEHHHEITTKNELFKNMKSYADERQQNAFYSIPLTFCLKISAERQASSIKQQIKPFKEVFNLLEEFKEQCDPDLAVKATTTLSQSSIQEQDATPASSCDKLVTPANKLLTEPMTVLITKKGSKQGYTDFAQNSLQDVQSRVKRFTSKSSGLVMPMCHFVGQNIWILKPTGFNRGKGIHVVNSLAKLKKLIKEYSRGREAQIGGPSTSQLSSTMPAGTQALNALASSTMYPQSRLMEPQALGTKQLMLATMQAATKTNNPFSRTANSVHKAAGSQSNSRQNLTGQLSSGGSKEYQPPKFIVNTSHKTGSGESAQVADQDPPMVISAMKETQEATVQKADQSDSMTTIEESTQSQADLPQQTVIMKRKPDGTRGSVPPPVNTTNPSGHATYVKPAIRSQTFIIQKYIERPLLINQRKFDIRVWVTLTQDMDVYFFKEGYLRTSSAPYNMNAQNLDDDFVHLTNNAIQKNSPDYGKSEDGNILSFYEFKRMIQKSGVKVDFDKDILQKMKYLCAVTLNTIKKKVNPNRRKHCFELFGLDFFIDQDYNVFLIEVNTNPCLEESSRLLKRLLPRMLDDLFKLTIDQIYLPTKDHGSQELSGTQIHLGRASRDAGSSAATQTGSDSKSGSLGPQVPHRSRRSIYPIEGHRDSANVWEKISTLKQNPTTANIPFNVDNPHPKQPSRSERLIHLVNQYEMRVGRPDLIEKSIKRDLQTQHLSAQQHGGLIDN